MTRNGKSALGAQNRKNAFHTNFVLIDPTRRKTQVRAKKERWIGAEAFPIPATMGQARGRV